MTIARSEQLFSISLEKEIDEDYEYTKRIKISRKSVSSLRSLDSINNTIKPDSLMDFGDDQIMKPGQNEFDDKIEDHNLICDIKSPSSRSSIRYCDSIDTLKEEES